MDEIVGNIDDKGRMLIPAEIRNELDIEPKDEVVVEIKKVRHRNKRDFIEVAAGCLKGFSDDPVKLMHEARGFRSRRKI